MKKREYKFRSWYKAPQTEKYEMWYFVFDDLNYQRICDIVDNSIVMQYTGLKDKNGKEIYEGDIVKDYSYERGRVKIIKFGEYYDADYYQKHWGFFISAPDNSSDENPLFEFLDKIEIIGNIYENPGLLK